MQRCQKGWTVLPSSSIADITERKEFNKVAPVCKLPSKWIVKIFFTKLLYFTFLCSIEIYFFCWNTSIETFVVEKIGGVTLRCGRQFFPVN
jgi:hypothetical protein